MIHLLRFGIFISCIVFFATSGAAQNLAKYRDFEFGMSLESVAKQARVEPLSARTIHTVPELIQTLEWNRPGYFSSAPQTDPVRSMRFDFYDNQLFKIVATYGMRELEGMISEDLIEGISEIYGPAKRLEDSVVISAYTSYETRQKVVARWENSEYAYSLFQSPYGGQFGLVAYSKKLEATAASSVREAERREALAAPQREIERQQKQVEDKRLSEEKARALNKPNFQP
jgi:hypothetical protein